MMLIKANPDAGSVGMGYVTMMTKVSLLTV